MNEVRRASVQRVLGFTALLAALVEITLVIAFMIHGRLAFRWLDVRVQVSQIARPLFGAVLVASLALWFGRRDWWIRSMSIAALVVWGLLLLVAISRQALAITPSGDLAVIEFYTYLAKDGRLLLGAYSRWGWNHPGPLYFYLLAPFYVLSDYKTTGLNAGALAINLGSLTALVLITFRAAGGRLALLISAALLLFVIRATGLLTSPWNPHVLVLPLMAFFISSAACIVQVSLLPLAALFATFAAQTHIGVVPAVTAVSATTLFMSTLAYYRSESNDDRARFRRALNWTLWLLVGAWFLPVCQQLFYTPGNLGRLWEFFATERAPDHLSGESFRSWAAMLAGMLRPDFGVASGRLIETDYFGLSQGIAIPLIAAMAVAIVISIRAGKRFHAALGTALLMASLVGLWSTFHVQGDIVDHTIFWLSGLGALDCALVADVVLSRWCPRSPWSLVSLTSSVGVGLILGASYLFGLGQLHALARPAGPLDGDDVTVRRLTDATSSFVRAELHRPLVRIDTPTWGVAAGTLLQFLKQDIPFGIEPGLIPMFTAAAAADGSETSILYFASPALHLRLLNDPRIVPIAEQDRIFVDAVRLISNATDAGAPQRSSPK